MKSMFAFALSCAALSLFGAGNPALQFADSITFHLSFDKKTPSADMALGEADPARKADLPVEYVPGIFGGQALKTGSFYFKTSKNFHPNKPGSLIVWVSPADWPEKAPTPQTKEPGFSVFGCGLGLGKQFNQRWGCSTVNVTCKYSKSCKSIHAFGTGNAKQWKNGTWHLLVAVWELKRIGISVDGSPLKWEQLPEKSVEHGLMRVGPGFKTDYNTVIDELTILNRVLTDGEITKLYQDGLKEIRK